MLGPSYRDVTHADVTYWYLGPYNTTLYGDFLENIVEK